jgi:8-oxo-dGTP diphosphatase
VPPDADYREDGGVDGSGVEEGRGGMRAIFFEADDAEAVAAWLRRGGFDATVEQERLAGEDDDQDHPWAVVTDALGPVVEVLVDEYDGWLDAAAGPESPPSPSPLDLPTAPRRVKRAD